MDTYKNLRSYLSSIDNLVSIEIRQRLESDDPTLALWVDLSGALQHLDIRINTLEKMDKLALTEQKNVR